MSRRPRSSPTTGPRTNAPTAAAFVRLQRIVGQHSSSGSPTRRKNVGQGRVDIPLSPCHRLLQLSAWPESRTAPPPSNNLARPRPRPFPTQKLRLAVCPTFRSLSGKGPTRSPIVAPRGRRPSDEFFYESAAPVVANNRPPNNAPTVAAFVRLQRIVGQRSSSGSPTRRTSVGLGRVEIRLSPCHRLLQLSAWPESRTAPPSSNNFARPRPRPFPSKNLRLAVCPTFRSLSGQVADGNEHANSTLNFRGDLIRLQRIVGRPEIGSHAPNAVEACHEAASGYRPPPRP